MTINQALEALKSKIDSIIMFTWSNWHTEMRSNRYHYSKRLSTIAPVIFIQADLDKPAYKFEKTELSNVTLLHIYNEYGSIQNQLLTKALKEKNINWPLAWIYNCNFWEFIHSTYFPFVVYHATEAFYSADGPITFQKETSLYNLDQLALKATDLLICVSEGIQESYHTNGNYIGSSIVINNGCDYQFYSLSARKNIPTKENIAFYQGNIFNKLDYNLLNQLVKRMKDWKFVFCGKVVFENDQGWKNLMAHENVKYLGLMQLEQLREIAYRSTVGIIPFVQKNFIKVSFPLKTYEYLASGLPVVSTPIDNLIKEDKEKVIHFASNVDDFEKAIRQASKERFDKELLEKRLSTAKRTSYDKRFKLCVNAIVQGLKEIKINPKTIEDKKLNILIFYYPNLKGLENIKNYTKFIKHNVYFLSSQFIAQSIIQEPESLNFFDGLVIDFSAILSNHSLTIFMEYAKPFQNYRGFKILCLRKQTSHFQPNLEELIRPHVNILSTKKNKSITFIKKSPIGEINLGTYNNLTNYFLALSTMFNTNVPARRISKPETIYAHITDLYPRINKKFFRKKIYIPGIIKEISLLSYPIDKQNNGKIKILKLIIKRKILKMIQCQFVFKLLRVIKRIFPNRYNNLKKFIKMRFVLD